MIADLAALEFIARSALRVLARAREAACLGGGDVLLAVPAGVVSGALLGPGGALGVHASVAAAAGLRDVYRSRRRQAASLTGSSLAARSFPALACAAGQRM